MQKREKPVKKLALNRETLMFLDQERLRDIAGGDSRANSCDPGTLLGCTDSKFC